MRKELGSGSYSEVYLCKRKEDKGKQNKYSALKCIDRTQIEREQKQHHVFVEKEVLFSFPDKKVVNLYSSFKDKDYFYLEIEYCKNGEFAKFLKSEKKLPLNTAKFFAAGDVHSSVRKLSVRHGVVPAGPFRASSRRGCLVLSRTDCWRGRLWRDGRVSRIN